MWMLSPAVRIFLAVGPTDLRRSFDGLSMIVREEFHEDPLSGHLFVFRNRRGDRVKILYWDRTGFWLFHKRLEKGVFRFPSVPGRSVEVEAPDLALLLEGIDLEGARRRPRISPRPPNATTAMR